VIRQLYRLFVTQVRRCGPVTILPEKTRIAFQVRMSFAALQAQRSKVIGHLVLAHRHERPCFVRIDSISRHNHTSSGRRMKSGDKNISQTTPDVTFSARPGDLRSWAVRFHSAISLPTTPNARGLRPRAWRIHCLRLAILPYAHKHLLGKHS
jgi:hypothetical protein